VQAFNFLGTNTVVSKRIGWIMKLVIVVPYNVERSGVVIFAHRLAQALIKYKIQPTFLSIGKYHKESQFTNLGFENMKAIIEWLSIHHDSFDNVLWMGFCENARSIKEQIICSKFLRNNAGKKIYFLWERTGENEVIPTERLLRDITSIATDIFVLNLDQYNTLNIIFPQHTHLISPGVDTQTQFIPPKSAREKHKIRQLLGWPKDQPIILSVGRFTKRKRTDLVMQNWLTSNLREISYLVVIGSGFDQKDSIEYKVKQLATLSTKIVIVPHKDDQDRAPFYRGADIFVANGITEGEPSVLSEAMGCGLPVVATNIPGHNRLVINNQTGLLFDSNDSQTFINSLQVLCINTDFRMALGRAARKKIIEERDITIVAKSIIEIIEK